MENDLSCVVCYDLYKDPVLIDCDHCFCRSCITQYWEQVATAPCPVCRQEASSRTLRPFRILADIVETFIKTEKAGEIRRECSLHKKQLKLFCQTDNQLICISCMISKDHQNHEVLPVDEAAEEFKVRGHRVTHASDLLRAAQSMQYLCRGPHSAQATTQQPPPEPMPSASHQSAPSASRRSETQSPPRSGYADKLRTLMKLILDKQQECNTVQSDYEKTFTHIQRQCVNTEEQIQAEFEKLHQFLHEEERIVLEDLKLEKEKNIQEMKERIAKITEEISSLSVTLQDIKRELSEQDDVKFLKRFQDIQKRVKQPLPEPQKVYPLINVGKYIGSLQYRVWKKMLTVINTAPVTLDPNTAAPSLRLSEDLCTVRYIGSRQQLPRNPERFDPYVFVLGSEGFTSGKHSWDVDVGNKTEWNVGVVKESCIRREKFKLTPGDGYLTVNLKSGHEYLACDKPPKLLELSVQPRKIRICLDYEGGKVSFYNSENKSHIYTFTGTFTEKLYPSFSPSITYGDKNVEALKICPQRVTIR
ncbi:zinc-binding protein A33-like [Hemiscyllium ocellatum]|uniref:zinc-binding protein A33-like n=1 Tax=Hemiscyllium ocellatum TaxID=170820 RepID=UPI0029672B77|nr:zinc-binding protein A33-like [Hemiscyllium ocellatum]